MTAFLLGKDQKIEDLEVTHGELGKVWGVTKARIGNLVQEGKLPKTPRGKLNLVECSVIFLNRLRKDMGLGDNKKVAEAYEKARAKKMEIQAKKEELDLFKKQGKVVDIEQVVDLVRGEYAIARQRLFAIPNKIALDVFQCETAEQVNALLIEHLNEALSGLSEEIDTEALRDESVDTQTVSEVDSDGVGG